MKINAISFQNNSGIVFKITDWRLGENMIYTKNDSLSYEKQAICKRISRDSTPFIDP